jgi:hypothetical protein
MRTWCAVALLLVTLPAAGLAQPAQPGPAEGGLALFSRWLTGEFDNFNQVFEQKETKVAVPHGRLHTVITPVAAPALGPLVFLARESPQNDPDRVGRVHLYSVFEAGGRITLRLYGFEDAAAVAAALNDPARASGPLPLDRVTPMPGCDVTWTREGDAFVGSSAPGACRVAAWPPAGKPVTLDNRYRLTADGLAFTEQAVDEAGTVVSAQPGGAPFDLRRARTFVCWAALRKDGTTDKYDGMMNVIMHDQGKWVAFRREDGSATPFAFELSQVRYGQKLPVMKLAIYETGKAPAVAYTWTEPEGTRIGVNLRWFQIGCAIRK